MTRQISTGKVLTEVVSGVGWVTFSNPTKRNSLSISMLSALDAVLRSWDADPAVKVMVVRGEGTEAFASGADISEFEEQKNSTELRYAADDAATGLFNTLEALSKPLVAMIHGYCMGAGVAVALGADLRIAAERARFAIPAAKLGIGYPVPLTHALVHTVGRAHAAELLFTGRTFTSREALEAGLVNRVVRDSDLLDHTKAISSTIAANAPLSVRAAKAAIRSTTDLGRRAEAQGLVGDCAASEDAVEGPRAFLQKREPKFIGA